MTIRFGTDGWRGVMDEDFTIDGVKLVAQAIADYIKSRGLARSGVVVGYDARRNSEEYAKACIEVLAGNGITTYKAIRDTPTPVVAFATTRLRASGAIMITASHNPPKYNGIKFIPHYGGPASTEITQEIERSISKAEVNAISIKEAEKKGLVAEIDFREEYVEWVLSLVDVDIIKRAKLKILANPLHGSARGYLDEVLRRAGCEVKCIRCDRDPSFGGLMPDPTLPETLSDMVSLMQGFDLGVATDGDGDRAAAYSKGFISPNMLFPILLKHMLDKGIKGGVVRTVATTHMVDEIAMKNGLKLHEVPVGFKNIAPYLLMGEAVIGGEESGGFGYKWHIPEKDGILTCLYIVEALASSEKRSIEDVMHDIEREYKLLYSIRGHVDILRPDRFKMALMSLEPKSIDEYRVRSICRIDGAKFITDKGWLLIRPSGTEPVVRVYAEAESPDIAKKMLEWGLRKAEELSRAC
ncbi:MAG: phosphoglucomutase/phosphomannomutase family protein [Candidatus Nezhaarchaeales archaeon]